MDIRRKLCELSEDWDLFFLEGMDSAVIGVAQPSEVIIVVYSRERMISIIKKDLGSYEDAVDDFNRRFLRLNLGPRTPIIVWGP